MPKPKPASPTPGEPGQLFEDTNGGLWMYSGDGDDHHIAEMQPNYAELAATIVRDHNEGPGLRTALLAVYDWAADAGPLKGKTPGDVAEYCRKAAQP
jgi:hypothetical protein